MFNEESYVVVGTIGTLVGLVAITAMLTTGRRWFAAISLIVGISFIIHGFYRRARRDQVTIRNIESKIRDWLESFGYFSSPIKLQNCHFGRQVNLPSGVILWLVRTTAHPSYITIVNTVPTTPEHKSLFNVLSPQDRGEFWREFYFETCRSKIAVVRNPNYANILDRFTIENLLPITSDLSEAAIIQAMREMDFQFNVVFNA